MVDEFTSVVDRTVGRIGASAVAKAVRARPGKRFVAVTCHDDVTDWLQPDWVLEPHVGAFAWRELQRRPKVTLEVIRAEHSAWTWFHPHHYLSADLHKGARCFVGLVDGRPACDLCSGEDLTVEFGKAYAHLAQLPGASFYHRLRERFGRLAY